MTVLYISLNLIAPVLIRVFFDVTYLDAIKIIMIIGFTFIFSAIYRIFTVILSYEKRNWIISIGAILQAVINLILNLMFIPNFGIFAAAASTSISLLVYALFSVTAHGYLKLKINPRFLFLVICLALTHLFTFLEWFDIINTLGKQWWDHYHCLLIILVSGNFPSNFVNMLGKVTLEKLIIGTANFGLNYGINNKNSSVTLKLLNFYCAIIIFPYSIQQRIWR